MTDQDRLREILNELHWENIAHLTGTHSNDDSHVVKAEKAILALIAREVRLGRLDEQYRTGTLAIKRGDPSIYFYNFYGSTVKRQSDRIAELEKEGTQ